MILKAFVVVLEQLMLHLPHSVKPILDFTPGIRQFLVVLKGIGELLDDAQQLYTILVTCGVVNV